MRTEEPRPIRLKDYRPPDWLVETVDLDVSLHPTATTVRAKLRVKPNGASAPAPLVLDGDELKLLSLALDGQAAAGRKLSSPRPTASPSRSRRTGRSSSRSRPWSIPTSQHAADGPLPRRHDLLHAMRGRRLPPHHLFPRPARRDGGLHDAHRGGQERSAGPARPTAISSPRATCPAPARHFAVWHDPFPKPSYLFALVGGKLACVDDSFVTMSGRDVALHIYVEPGKEERCALRHGQPQARHALGRGGVRARIRSRHLHDRRRLRLQHGRDGEQGPQRLQRQIRAGLAGDRDRRRTTPASRRSSRTNISTTGPATASPAATGSSSA